MHILIAGSSGFLGSSIIQFLIAKGHRVTRLVRSRSQMTEDSILWHPETKKINKSELEGFDVIINLAGDNIASGRWSKAKKEKIYKSRVETTAFLTNNLAQLENPPALLINASAVGFYGNCVNQPANEEHPPGQDFLAQVCRDWEKATLHAEKKGIRVVNLRLGVVLSTKGGIVAKMLIPFKLSLGGKLGSGKQILSWISLEDLFNVIHHVMNHAELAGPINAVTPNAVTNLEFTEALGNTLKRPTFFHVPTFVIKLIFGEMAESTLLGSTWAVPEKLEKSGFTFAYPKLPQALEALFKIET